MATNGVAEQAEYFLPQCREAFDEGFSDGTLHHDHPMDTFEHLENPAQRRRFCGHVDLIGEGLVGLRQAGAQPALGDRINQ